MRSKISLFFVLAIALVFLGFGCSSTSSEVLKINEDTYITQFEKEKINKKISETGNDKAELNDQAKQKIIYMIEGEKLARDLYYKFSDKYDYPNFEQLYKAEQTQKQALQKLAEKYGLENPAAKKGIGEFKNPQIQNYYDSYLKQGNKNLSEAIKSSNKAEEIAALIYPQALSKTNKKDVKFVLKRLNIAAKNHLRLHAQTIEDKGIKYDKPTHLKPADYNRIIHSSIEPRPWWRFW